MEVSGQLHDLTALAPGKEPSVPIGYEAGWTPEPVWTTWKRENSWSYHDSNSNPLVVQPVESRYTNYATPAHISKKCTFMIICILVSHYSLKKILFSRPHIPPSCQVPTAGCIPLVEKHCSRWQMWEPTEHGTVVWIHYIRTCEPPQSPVTWGGELLQIPWRSCHYIRQLSD
jgi:hypothetical protein